MLHLIILLSTALGQGTTETATAEPVLPVTLQEAQFTVIEKKVSELEEEMGKQADNNRAICIALQIECEESAVVAVGPKPENEEAAQK